MDPCELKSFDNQQHGRQPEHTQFTPTWLIRVSGAIWEWFPYKDGLLYMRLQPKKGLLLNFSEHFQWHCQWERSIFTNKNRNGLVLLRLPLLKETLNRRCICHIHTVNISQNMWSVMYGFHTQQDVLRLSACRMLPCFLPELWQPVSSRKQQKQVCPKQCRWILQLTVSGLEMIVQSP